MLVTDDGEASAGSRPITAIMHTDTGRVHSQLEAEAFGIAMRYKITIYDALYIALAKEKRASSLTRDGRWSSQPGVRNLRSRCPTFNTPLFNRTHLAKF